MTHRRSTYLRTRASLIARIQAGADGPAWNEAWNEFYDVYWRAVYGYALGFGASRNDAEDLVHEVFVKISRKIPSFDYDRTRGRFLSWVKTITRTTVLDSVRRKQVRAKLGVRLHPDGPDDNPFERVADTKQIRPEEELDRAIDKALLAEALQRVKDRLSENVFEAFQLCVFGERDPQDVADRLGVKRNTVHQYKKRGMAAWQEEAQTLLADLEGADGVPMILKGAVEPRKNA